MQVMRLEKLVKLLEDQQDRAQAQRTRLEHRIAQLEINLREKNNNNRYVMKKYSNGKPRSNIIDDKLSRVFSCESKQALMKASMPTFRLIDSRSCDRSESSHYQYYHTSPIKNPFFAPEEFYLDDCRRASSDNEEAFVCEQCQHATNEKFKHGIIRHVKDHQVPIRESLYSWLMDSSALEAFGEPTIGLNNFHNRHNSFEKDTDCFFRIVDPVINRDNEEGRSRKSHRRREQYCRRYSRFSKRFLHNTSRQFCNPIIRMT